jgi:hypothetical protein
MKNGELKTKIGKRPAKLGLRGLLATESREKSSKWLVMPCKFLRPLVFQVQILRVRKSVFVARHSQPRASIAG